MMPAMGPGAPEGVERVRFMPASRPARLHAARTRRWKPIGDSVLSPHLAMSAARAASAAACRPSSAAPRRPRATDKSQALSGSALLIYMM